MADRKAPYEVLERLAMTSCLLADAIDSGGPVPPMLFQDRLDAMKAYRAAVGPQSFHERVAEALGLMDGDQGRYVYADEERCLEELRRNRRDAESWRERPQAPIDCEFPEADPVPCDCDVLRDQLHRIRALAKPVGSSSIPTRAERALQQILEVLG